MSEYIQVLFYSLIGGLFSLTAGMLLLSNKKSAGALAKFATPFAAGALLAAAFFDLLPEAIASENVSPALNWTLLGIVVFFVLEHLIHWFHHHHQHREKSMQAAAPLIIIGDSIHNLLDGIAIGAAFLISPPAGISAAIAVAAHEIPQEIGDFGLLLKAGLERKNVILINVASSLMSTLGALVTFWIGSDAGLPAGVLLAVTAGMFIYIATSDLIPHIHETAKKGAAAIAIGLMLAGIFMVGAAGQLAHDYIDVGPNHSNEEPEAEPDVH